MLSSFLKGLGLGAAWMYFYDPDRGRRRRSLCWDRCVAAVHDLERFVEVGSRDLSNRLQGFLATQQRRLRSEHPTDSLVLERVRSTMGHCVSHPHSIDVDVHQGCVTLQGQVPAHEVRELVQGISQVQGVRDVVNRLQQIEGAFSPRQRTGCQQGTPAERLVTGTLGTLLVANCLLRRSPLALAAGVVGASLCWRALGDESRPLPRQRERSGVRIPVSAQS